MSATRGSHNLPPRNGSVVRSHGQQLSEELSSAPQMSDVSNVTRSPVNPNNGTNQQRPVTQANSGVVRYLLNI